MNDNTTTPKTNSRAIAALGMLVAFLGGYVLGSMSRLGEPGAAIKRAAQAERAAVPVGLSPTQGPRDALVTVVVFSDFQCGFCARSVPVLKRLRVEFGDDVRLVFKNLPLGFHARSRPAAEASMAAHAQGYFWEYHDKLFANARDLSDADLVRYAEQLGMDVERFKTALDSGTYAKPVQADLDLAKELNVRGTPNFYINGRHFAGALSWSRIAPVIREELAHARQAVRQGVPRSEIYYHLTKPAGANKGEQGAAGDTDPASSSPGATGDEAEPADDAPGAAGDQPAPAAGAASVSPGGGRPVRVRVQPPAR